MDWVRDKVTPIYDSIFNSFHSPDFEITELLSTILLPLTVLRGGGKGEFPWIIGLKGRIISQLPSPPLIKGATSAPHKLGVKVCKRFSFLKDHFGRVILPNGT